jgi:hypothetical protein
VRRKSRSVAHFPKIAEGGAASVVTAHVIRNQKLCQSSVWIPVGKEVMEALRECVEDGLNYF